MQNRFALALVLLGCASLVGARAQDVAPPRADPPGLHRPDGMPSPVWDAPASGGIRANPPTLQGFAQETEGPEADVDAAQRDGFLVAANEMEHWGDPGREVVAEHFVNPLGATVGRKPPLDFSYDLMDLNGSGYRSLILWPRIIQVQPRVPDFGGVLKIYTFDGKDWHLALDDAAMMLAVRPHLDASNKPTGYMDLALLEQDGYKLFVYDPATGDWSRRAAPKR